jgi:ATP-dependent Lon protease
MPEVLYDPRQERELMARVSEPSARNMKGGFRHDPYQSGEPPHPGHKRAYLGAHATAPIIYIDELKTLVKMGYMADLLEIMQNKKYILEGGRTAAAARPTVRKTPCGPTTSSSPAATTTRWPISRGRATGPSCRESRTRAKSCTWKAAVPETPETIRHVAQYVKQEIVNLGEEFRRNWGEMIAREGHDSVPPPQRTHFRQADLPPGLPPAGARVLPQRRDGDHQRAAVPRLGRQAERILRPINGIIRTAEFEAILENSDAGGAGHVRKALAEHLSLGGQPQPGDRGTQEVSQKIHHVDDGLHRLRGRVGRHPRPVERPDVGQPLPIHCQITVGSADKVAAPGKMGDIAKAAAQNVRASIKKVLKTIGAPNVGYEMHVEYIQAHGGVEGDSASVAMDIALISDFIQQPVNQRFGVTGSLTGDIILAVGGVTEKIRSIMDSDLGMEGACIPWLNKHDIEPLLVNAEAEYTQQERSPASASFRAGPAGAVRHLLLQDQVQRLHDPHGPGPGAGRGPHGRTQPQGPRVPQEPGV